MATEYELKYKATLQVLAAMEAAFPGDWTRIRMETVYYDTPSGALSQRRYTLRRRLENGVSVCTLKTPAGDARGEWETECDTIEAAIPNLIALGAPAELAELTREGFVHICGARFTRLAKTISPPDCTVEIALDQGILLGGGKTEPLCEAEVELKTGAKAACDTFSKDLAHRFGLQVEEKSKFRRALALYKGE
ncbi:MAG: CYTH domain-containing protein [Oscillospiraceae bacterium]|nr:CYTH domain-containing protein [Oscillospiraceae bacterium]